MLKDEILEHGLTARVETILMLCLILALPITLLKLQQMAC